MPAARSRTEHWRRSLEQIHERGGALEITLPRFFEGGDPSGMPDEGQGGSLGSNLIWRVRILGLSEDEILVEQPSALGQVIRIEDGVDLVGVIAVGQNRWMFATRNIGRRSVPMGQGRDAIALRLTMPSKVERCQRRSFYRIATIGLELPRVDCWPVLEPMSLPAAEMSNQARIQMLDETGSISPDREREQLVMPEVGPSFESAMVNIGGGGVGLVVEPAQSAGLERCRLFWLQVDLRPHVPAPLGVAGRLVHTHRDSEQRLYAGLAFEFDHNPGHKRFVVDRLCRCVTLLQRAQLARRAA